MAAVFATESILDCVSHCLPLIGTLVDCKLSKTDSVLRAIVSRLFFASCTGFVRMRKLEV